MVVVMADDRGAAHVREALWIALGLTDDELDERIAVRAARRHPCRFCGAREWERCVSTGSEVEWMHPSRRQ